MPKGRLVGRLWVAGRAFLRSTPWRRKFPGREPETIVVLHALLLGDTLMLAALFKALRSRWPGSRIISTCMPAVVPLFAGRPWGVEAIAFDPRHPETFGSLFAACREGVDLAILPGENRYSLLARACGARWIRGLVGDSPAWKDALCDELISWPDDATGLSEIFSSLSGKERLEPYQTGEWPSPPAATSLTLPPQPYAVLHLGASNPLRYWPARNWSALAEKLAESGLKPIWSSGHNETGLVAAADPGGLFSRQFAGTLDLTGLWHLLANASLVVCVDSGVAHLAKLIGCPTVCIFGQGSPTLFGEGYFFRNQPFVSVADHEVACRDQQHLFGRKLSWVRRCSRRSDKCNDAVCIKAVSVEWVETACKNLLLKQRSKLKK